MLLSVQTCFVSPTFQEIHRKFPSDSSKLLTKTLFPCFQIKITAPISKKLQQRLKNGKLEASLLERPVIWAGRICIFYALLKAGLAGSQSNPFLSAEYGDDLWLSKWLENLQAKSGDKEASDRRKLVSKWHPTTKGTLKRSYRVPSKSEGRRLLKSIASLLSDDDHFRDVTSHKGCQIRRENAHGESVCCNNVRALFDELPTPHLVVEITVFPAGPLTDKDYAKAEKLERVLRSGASI